MQKAPRQSTRPDIRGPGAIAVALWLALPLPTIALAQEAQVPAPTPAADTATPPAQPEDPRATALVQRDAAQQTYLRLMAEERYDEAASIAAQIVDLTTRLYGENSIELAMPLTNLATAKFHQDDLVAAETNYRASIAIIEAKDGLGSSRLVNPLVGLAETYMKARSYQQANATYRRALQTNHAADGFYNLEQMKILDGLSESYLALDKLPQANAQQRVQVTIQRHRSGPDSPDLAPALYKLGRWYNRTGQYPEARDAYQDARRIISESSSDSDPAMVDALLGEAITYENEGAVPASASTIKRALDLLDSQPEPDHLKRAEVLVALGDLYTVAGQPRSARQRYVQAWRELSGDDTLLTERDNYFARPSRISGPRLPAVVSDGGAETAATSGLLAKGYVVASLTVNADGEARNTVIIESQPPGLMDKQVLRALADTAFRPRMEDGATVPSEAVQFRHDFRYSPPVAASGEPVPSAAPESAGEKGGRINYPDAPDEPDGAAKP